MNSSVGVKICGLTDSAEAVACAEAGADAIGFVFYRPSPRNISPEDAGRIIRALPSEVIPVGVFVDMGAGDIIETAHVSGIRSVQLHGCGDSRYIERLRSAGLRVITVLKRGGDELIGEMLDYSAADAFLVECSSGPLPGGNAAEWDWRSARPLSGIRPMAVAGGLSAENIELAIEAANPDAVDVSSCVEREPGRKDLDKVREFIRCAGLHNSQRTINRVF